MIVFAFADTKRPFCTEVLATDSSGPDSSDFGGFGVVSKEWPRDTVLRYAQRAEKWRFSALEALDARRAMLLEAGIELPQQLFSDSRRIRRERKF